MRRISLLVISAMALCAVAPAQFNNTVMVPGIKITKTKDDLEKKVKRGVVNYWYKNGKLFATRDVDMLPDPRTVVDKKYQYQIFIQLDNVTVEHMKVRAIPDPASLVGKEQKVRGASNATRKVFNLPFQELDIYQGADRKNAFGGGLDFSSCRLGDNILEVAAFTKHAQQVELDVFLFSGSSTTWRRNTLDDGMHFTVVDMPEMQLVVEGARNGWKFVDPAIDRQAKRLAAMPEMALPNLQPPSGNGNNGQNDTQTGQGNSTTGGSQDDSNLERTITFSLNGQSFSGGTMKTGSSLEVSSNRPFSVEVYRLSPDPADRPIQTSRHDMQNYKGHTGYWAGLTLNLIPGGKYRIEIVDDGRMIGQTTVEVGK